MNIVFDLAGVVVRYDQAALIAEVFADSATHTTVRTDIIGHVDWLALDRGTLSQQDAIVRAAHRTRLSATNIAQFLEQMSSAWVTISGTVDLLHRLHAVIALVQEGDGARAPIADQAIFLPEVPEFLTPVVYLVPLHRFTYWLALEMGHNPATFRRHEPRHAAAFQHAWV